ncbi:MAG TPA: RNA-binding protein [Candidatus Polarisedimenticolia bacterium]|nr:RNA-binding protein [Candidatus Polarisedimenticolia bacterium]
MGRKLFVSNLSFDTSDADLREPFARIGTCEAASVIKDRMTGRSRGFGFVEMSSDEEARRAIAEINGTELQGRMISVREARERSEGGPPSRPGASRGFSPSEPPSGPRFRKDGGSRRGLRARKRSL